MTGIPPSLQQTYKGEVYSPLVSLTGSISRASESGVLPFFALKKAWRGALTLFHIIGINRLSPEVRRLHLLSMIDRLNGWNSFRLLFHRLYLFVIEQIGVVPKDYVHLSGWAYGG